MSQMSRDVDELSLVAPLVRVADLALRAGSIDSVTIDTVAAQAGVSRATAFRQLGRRDDMIVAVALLRASEYTRVCIDEMKREFGTFDKIEAGFRYFVRVIPADPVMHELLVIRTADELDVEVHDIATATLGPVFERGRLEGQVRMDVALTDIITWTVEQLYLAMQQRDRSEEAIRKRVRTFLAPALSVREQPDAALQARADRVSVALQSAQQALDVLRSGLP
jgi:AcrR family transcriptional regulator